MQSTISNAHNVRQTRLAFPAQNRGVCHGLAGYLDGEPADHICALGIHGYWVGRQLYITVEHRFKVAQNRGVCHGLAGYFETVLYGDVELSTNPVTMDAKSANMISWFPIYFPLKVSFRIYPTEFKVAGQAVADTSVLGREG
jgi:phage shock protein PspC (stress-responsive transcriptional regulator)